MAAPLNRQEFPEPHRDWRGAAEVDAPPARSIAKIARLWATARAILELPAATLARVAHRLVDRTTGIPYSADELQTKITTDLGSGFDAKANLSGGNTWSGNQTGLVAAGLTINLGAEVHALSGTAGSGFVTHSLPMQDGTIPIVPSYTDLTAANAALSSGEFWWDSTSKKLRVTTA